MAAFVYGLYTGRENPPATTYATQENELSNSSVLKKHTKKFSKQAPQRKTFSRASGHTSGPAYGARAASGYMTRNAIGMPVAHLGSTPASAKPATVHTPKAAPRTAHRESLGARAIAHLKRFALDKADETAFFEPKTWAFWRGIIMYLFVFSVVGHWLEIPYCLSMHALFGIVDSGYAIWSDPLYVPYWVYGIGAAIVTLMLMPLKIHIIGKRKTMWGAALEFFAICVVMCAVMECVMGWIINQPDEFGQYPYWDNSVLPLNIFDQAWLVNDFFLGLVALGYVWFAFPFCQKAMRLIGERAANRVFVSVLVLFGFICLSFYGPDVAALIMQA